MWGRNDPAPVRVFPPVTVEPSDIEPSDIEPSDIERNAALSESASITPRVIERPDDHRFELLIGGEVVSFATYSVRPEGVVVVPHVETRVEHRGSGHAGQLMDGMLGLLRSSGRQIVPVCPFAAAHVRSDVRYHDLLAG